MSTSDCRPDVEPEPSVQVFMCHKCGASHPLRVRMRFLPPSGQVYVVWPGLFTLLLDMVQDHQGGKAATGSVRLQSGVEDAEFTEDRSHDVLHRLVRVPHCMDPERSGSSVSDRVCASPCLFGCGRKGPVWNCACRVSVGSRQVRLHFHSLAPWDRQRAVRRRPQRRHGGVECTDQCLRLSRRGLGGVQPHRGVQEKGRAAAGLCGVDNLGSRFRNACEWRPAEQARQRGRGRARGRNAHAESQTPSPRLGGRGRVGQECGPVRAGGAADGRGDPCDQG
mmetsp:Transcript_42817/g.100649  ORF Transcript_42817/g.100649 Transcript_42817/m.100649 type:complete len:279 (+) Transcript_42817:363-1199(+)